MTLNSAYISCSLTLSSYKVCFAVWRSALWVLTLDLRLDSWVERVLHSASHSVFMASSARSCSFSTASRVAMCLRFASRSFRLCEKRPALVK